MCIPKLYCIVKLWLNDTAVDEHKHMRGAYMFEHDMVLSISTQR